jgi:hypothetical protein
VTRATQPPTLPKLVIIIGAIIAVAAFGYLYKSCAELPTEPVSINSYKQNIPKFQAMLPRWSKLIQSESETLPQEELAGYLKGKIIILRLSDDNSCTLADQNVNWRLHESGLIASSPEEVGTIVFIHAFLDRSALYQARPHYPEEGQATYSLMYYKVYIVDKLSGEIVGRLELHLTGLPPSTIKESETHEPVAQFADYLIHLTKRKIDQEMIDIFQAHKTDFVEILQMFRSDKGLLHFFPDNPESVGIRDSDLTKTRRDCYTRPQNPQSVGISAERLKQYQAVFSRLGIDGICDMSRSGSKDEVWFFTSIEGPWIHTYKHYAFVAQPTGDIVHDLDHRASRAAPYRPYSLIEDYWYLVLEDAN